MKKPSRSAGRDVGGCYLSSSTGPGQWASAASSLCQPISCKLLIWHIPHNLCPLKPALDSVPDPSSYITHFCQNFRFLLETNMQTEKPNHSLLLKKHTQLTTQCLLWCTTVLVRGVSTLGTSLQCWCYGPKIHETLPKSPCEKSTWERRGSPKPEQALK